MKDLKQFALHCFEIYGATIIKLLEDTGFIEMLIAKHKTHFEDKNYFVKIGPALSTHYIRMLKMFIT